MDIKTGDKFKKVYPFKHWEHTYDSFDGPRVDEGWAGGCHDHVEDGPAVYEGQCIQEIYYTADGEGFIEYEVLAVAEMPRKYQTRIIYRVTMIDPEENERKSSKCHTVTEAKFREWIESGHSSYPKDYTVE